MNVKHQRFKRIFLELIHEKGFKATTMRDLALEMNCDVSNLYNYTASKQAFLVKILFQINNDFQNHIDTIMCSALTPVDQLKKLVEVYVDLSLARPLELSLLTNEWRNLKGKALIPFIKERENFERKLKKIIKKGMDQNLLKPINIDLATHLFLSSLRLLFDNYTEANRDFNKERLASEIKSYIFCGLLLNVP